MTTPSAKSSELEKRVDAPTAAQIAGMLSADQRDRIVNATCCRGDKHPHCVCAYDYDDLMDFGLVTVGQAGPSGIYRTPLGLAVRAILMERSRTSTDRNFTGGEGA